MKFLSFKKRQVDDTNLSGVMQKYITGLNLGWQWGDNSSFEKLLSETDYKKAYYNNPLIWHGINKKARDLLFYGFEIDSPLDDVDVPDNLEKELDDFLRDKKILYIINRCIKDTYTCGDGWFEYNCSGSKDPMQPLSGSLNGIKYVNPDSMVGYKLDKDQLFVEYWIYKQGSKRIPIHYTRLEHFAFHLNGDDPFGMSIIEIASRAVKALINATKSLDDNLQMFGHPFPVIKTTDNTNKKQVEDAYNALQALAKKELKVGFAGFKDSMFDLLNPSVPNPEQTLQHFYIEIAAALEMPMLLLTGSQMSKLTGNEIELNDYYKGINSVQEIFLSPVFNKIFKFLIGDRWQYQIYWNPLFVDETSEIENKSILMEKVGMLYTSGIVDVGEARQLLREYDINIPENMELDNAEENMEEEEETIPAPVVEEEKTKLFIRKPTEEELIIAKKQRILGEKLIREGAAK
jgi:hypothetical protein